MSSQYTIAWIRTSGMLWFHMTPSCELLTSGGVLTHYQWDILVTNACRSCTGDGCYQSVPVPYIIYHTNIIIEHCNERLSLTSVWLVSYTKTVVVTEGCHRGIDPRSAGFSLQCCCHWAACTYTCPEPLPPSLIPLHTRALPLSWLLVL